MYKNFPRKRFVGVLPETALQKRGHKRVTLEERCWEGAREGRRGRAKKISYNGRSYDPKTNTQMFNYVNNNKDDLVLQRIVEL